MLQAVYDAARLAIVHKYGGFYMDADHVVIKVKRPSKPKS